MYALPIACSCALLLIIVLLIVLRKKLTLFLRDKSTLMPEDQRTFSMSSTMIFYWTVLIFASICYIGIVSGSLPTIESGVLILMGIVVGTTTAGKVIDTTQSIDPTIARSQDMSPTQGFLTDILSDANGISVARFQTLVFNIIYGFAFLSIVITKQSLYDFPPQTLTLLGISSGAYALLKIPENSKPTVNPPTPQQATTAIS
ncbi:hypothetical protein [Mucilaginibacter sp. OK098]|uniref:hypothetical protein n=1 Tax=Mucilaginibacter sp. OK098 TaxID=1855297 RepID=UPI00091758A8|nr:hypothetical protein [Mucilaginibacter sp. OK098]SHN26188.1 hypothetical protein SAMN05216524_107388 [Mucilaginibacter sp. OK098]